MEFVNSISPILDQCRAKEGKGIVLTSDAQMLRLLTFDDGAFYVIGCWATATFIHDPRTDFYFKGIGYTFKECVSYACLEEADIDLWEELYHELSETSSTQEISCCNQFWGVRIRQVVIENAFHCKHTPQGIILYVNHAFCAEYNCEPGHFVGRSFYEFVPKSQHKEIRQHLASFSLSSPEKEFDYLCGEVEGGCVRIFRCTDRALFDGDGNVYEFDCHGSFLTIFVSETAKT